MKLHIIDTGLFKLDGGAMFGVVPKVLWSKRVEADANNLCNWAARCLLIEDGERLILVDTGLGDKQSEKFFGYYYRSGEATLLDSLRRAGFTRTDVTDVILTHLHFDHSGGAVSYNADRTRTELTFPYARYWSNQAHWDWAIRPNPREKASFLTENILPIRESGQLRLVVPGESPFPGIEFIHVNGHTEQMMLPLITTGSGKFLFASDLFPSAAHLPLAWVMGYDVRPLITMEEKEQVLKRVLAEDITLIFQHDAVHEAAVLQWGEKGITVKETAPLGVFV